MHIYKQKPATLLEKIFKILYDLDTAGVGGAFLCFVVGFLFVLLSFIHRLLTGSDLKI